MAEKKYWNGYYTEVDRLVRDVPSQFACFVASEVYDDNPIIIEIGCGTGRDARFLSTLGFQVYAYDQSESAISCAELVYKGTAKFRPISTFDDIEIPPRKEKKICLYNRFFLHAISDNEQETLLRWITSNLKIGDLFTCEYRNDNDRERSKVTATHFRRYINDDQFITKLKNVGFVVNYHVSGIGYAKYKNDDAAVTRLIACKVH